MVKLKYTIEGSDLPQNNDAVYVVVNLPVGLTIQQRKLHRSCLEYEITGGYMKDTQGNAKVTFATAYDNWVTRAALRRGRNHWLKMHKEILSNNPQLKPKWHDYKCALVDRQVLPSNMQSFAFSEQQIPEDWVGHTIPHDDRGITYSVFTTEDGMPANQIGNGSANLVDTDKDEFTSHLIGPHITDQNGTSFVSIGLIESWFKSRPDIEPITTVDSQEMDSIVQDPLNMLFNDGDADNEIIENFDNAVNGDNDSEGDMFPMYSNEVVNYKVDNSNYGSFPMLQEVAAVSTSAANPVSYFTGFKSILGQVVLKIVGDFRQNDDLELVFEVNPRGKTI